MAFHAYVKEMHGSRSKISSKISRLYIHISRLRVNFFIYAMLQTRTTFSWSTLYNHIIIIMNTTKRDMTRLEAAEMRFLRSVKGYTRLDKIKSEVIRKELNISGIQDVTSEYKRNWINYLERTD